MPRIFSPITTIVSAPSTQLFGYCRATSAALASESLFTRRVGELSTTLVSSTLPGTIEKTSPALFSKSRRLGDVEARINSGNWKGKFITINTYQNQPGFATCVRLWVVDGSLRCRNRSIWVSIRTSGMDEQMRLFARENCLKKRFIMWYESVEVKSFGGSYSHLP